MVDLVDSDDWRRWLTSRRGRAQWAAWSGDRPALAGWGPDELAHPRWSPAVDALQRELVALAQDGHDRAAITLLVQLRPGLGRLVRHRELTGGESRASAVDEVRSAFYETLCRHRLDRRPRRIAANLVLDTRQRLDRTAGAERGPLPIGTPTDPTPPSPASPDPGDGLAPVLALRRAVADLGGSDRSRALTAEAAYRAWILDQPHGRIADELGLDPAAVRTRLHRLRTIVRHRMDEATQPPTRNRAA